MAARLLTHGVDRSYQCGIDLYPGAVLTGSLLLPHSNYLPSLTKLTVNWEKTMSHWLPSCLRDKKLKLQGTAAGLPPRSSIDPLRVVSLMLSLHDLPTHWPH